MGQGNGTAPKAAGMGWGRPGAHTGRLGRCKPAAAPQPPHRSLGSEEGLVLQGKERDWPSVSFHQRDTEAGRTDKGLAGCQSQSRDHWPCRHLAPRTSDLHLDSVGTFQVLGTRSQGGQGRNSSHGLLALRDLRGLKLSVCSMRK